MRIEDFTRGELSILTEMVGTWCGINYVKMKEDVEFASKYNLPVSEFKRNLLRDADKIIELINKLNAEMVEEGQQ